MFCQDCSYTRGTELILTCSGLFERHYKQMRKIFILLCKNLTDKYHLNISRIITLIYHIFIEYESYNLAYNKTLGPFYEHQFVCTTKGMWDILYTFTRIIGE